MSEIFLEAFGGMLTAVAKIFIIALAAGILVRKKIIKQEYIRGLSELTVKVLLPSLIFTKIITSFNPDTTPGWWALPIIGILAPCIILLTTSSLFVRKIPEKINIFPLAAFQNAGYLVLPIAQILYPDDFDQFALYIFLFILGFSPTLWSIGKLLITKSEKKEKFKISGLITPPVVASLTALLLVLTGGNAYIPEVITDPVSLLGSATIPIAIFILGATLGSVSLKIWPEAVDIIKIISVKFVIVPGLVMLLLYYYVADFIPPLLSDFFIIQASAPAAANLIIMIRKYGGDAQKIGSLMLISYFIAVPVMPFWIALWKIIQ